MGAKERVMMRRILFAVALAGAMTGSGAAQTAKNDYGDAMNWLCRPGQQDACAIDLTTTVVAADGTLTREAFKANPNPPIDCFYVYPTVSTDPSPNSDMSPGAEEKRVVAGQAARFQSQCRVFAPIYRQVTVRGLMTGLLTKPGGTPERTLAYNDVVDAWNHYLQHDNNGRGVVLLSHSQGSFLLQDLIANEIEGKPVQSRLVSAILLGTSLPVPTGKNVGGAFKMTPLCTSASQTGCVISYASFRSTIPPPATSLFGHVSGEGMMSACTNPAALAGGSADVHAYLNATGTSFLLPAAPQPEWATGKTVDTPWVSVPGLLTAQCVNNEHGSYLEVTVHGNPSDPRADDIVGDLLANNQPNAAWGLHLLDVNLTLGNLVDIVGQQAKAYASKRGRR
jgi:DUF3089 family protein